MIFSESRFADRERSSVKSLRVVSAPKPGAKTRQVVESACQKGMVFPQSGFANGRGAAQKLFSLLQPAQLDIENRHVLQHGRHFRVVLAVDALANSQAALIGVVGFA